MDISPVSKELHSFFFIRTSNFSTETERSKIFSRKSVSNVLKHVLKISLLIFDNINNTCTVCGTFVYTLICTCISKKPTEKQIF